MKAPPLPRQSSRNRFRSFRRSSRAACRCGKFLALLAASSWLLATGALGANMEADVASDLAAGADLLSGTSYTSGGAPAGTSDVTFNASNTYKAKSYSISATGAFGSLNDLSATAITIQNANPDTPAPLTLKGGNSVSGNTPDLLYVAKGATLTFQAAHTQSIVLGASGNFNVAGTATISAPIVGGATSKTVFTTSPYSLTKTGAGKLTLTNTANNFSGGTTVNAGTLVLGAGGTTGVVTETLTVNAGAKLVLSGNNAIGFYAGSCVTTLNVNGGSVDSTAAGKDFNQGYLTKFNLTGGTLSSSGGATYNFNVAALPPPTITSNASAATSVISGGIVARNAGTLAFNVAAGTAGTANGSDLTVSGVITSKGGGGISKAGAGILTLTGTNTYGGPTIVKAGSLFVTGGTPTGSAVAVSNAGTTFGGTGTVAGIITIGAGATLSAGNRAPAAPVIGTLTTGPLTLQKGSTFNALLAGNNSVSTLSATGATALGGAAFTISLTPGATFTNNSVLQVITSNVSGTFTNTVYTAGGYTFTADYTTDPGFFDVNVTVVSKPSA